MSDNLSKIKHSLIKRHRRETRYRIYGIGSILIAATVLFLLFGSIFISGVGSFFQDKIKIDIVFAAKALRLGDDWTSADLKKVRLSRAINNSIYSIFPEFSSRSQKSMLRKLRSSNTDAKIKQQLLKNPQWVGQTVSIWITASHYLVNYLSNEQTLAQDSNEYQIIKKLKESKRIKTAFNSNFFTNGDSRSPEHAGILGALVGTFYTLLITFFICFPIGIAASIYLEEFAPKNRFTDLIEVNINNLAAVPSIIFGLLGLSVFINFFNLPRSSPLVGGIVLSLMTLPVIIIASRASLRSIPSSIKEAALGVGASKMQAVFHHSLPLAMPGILTGSIIGMSRALGETAPLLMIGMVAFVVDIPQSFSSAATVLPVQVFLWADSPELAFVEKTSAAILVLLSFLVLMNFAAIIIRNKLARRW